MLRHTVCAGLTVFALGTRGERIEAVYREGVETVCTVEESFRITTGDVSLSMNGEELPPEEIGDAEMEFAMSIETSIRARDRVLAAADGRPTKVRREFEELREKTVEDGEETEKTGPLEGRALALDDDGGEVTAEPEGDGGDVDDLYLENHRLTNYVDCLLPDREVAIGDSWQVEDDALREFLGIGSTGPVLFEPDEEEEDDPLEEALDEATWTAEVEFAAIEERDGLRCAVLALTLDFAAEVDDPAAFGVDPDAGDEVSCVFDLEARVEGRLWWSLEQSRPVAMEQSLDGKVDIGFRMRATMGEEEMLMESEVHCSVEGQTTFDWSVVD